jgi:hypothetical protein
MTKVTSKRPKRSSSLPAGFPKQKFDRRLRGEFGSGVQFHHVPVLQPVLPPHLLALDAGLPP